MRRLGVLTPSSNTVLEPAIARLTAPLAGELSVHYARFPVTRVAADGTSDEQFAPSVMLDAARLLAHARVDLILWSGTSGAWLGIEYDKTLVAAIDQSLGVRATTATLGLLEAFEALRVARYGLVVPYVGAVTEPIVANLRTLGFECVAKVSEGLSCNWEFATIAAATLA